MLIRKQPRDFVHIDEFWEADAHWPTYYIGNKVWVFADEYHADLSGDSLKLSRLASKLTKKRPRRPYWLPTGCSSPPTGR